MSDDLDIYQEQEPTVEDIVNRQGLTVLNFGANWCPFCKAAAPLVGGVLAEHADMRQFAVADGKGKRLGRHYRVKLWPTLIFLKDGVEYERLVRPQSQQEVQQVLNQGLAMEIGSVRQN